MPDGAERPVEQARDVAAVSVVYLLLANTRCVALAGLVPLSFVGSHQWPMWTACVPEAVAEVVRGDIAGVLGRIGSAIGWFPTLPSRPGPAGPMPLSGIRRPPGL